MKRHPLDAVSMVFGLVFAGLGSLYLTGNDVGDLVTRFWPAALVVLGLAILFSARRAGEVIEPTTPVAPAPGPAMAPPAAPPDRAATKAPAVTGPATTNPPAEPAEPADPAE